MLARHTPSNRQSGAAVIEFALIAVFFFTLLLGIVELGRLLYVWNTVQEVSRRAAREAAVRNFISDGDAIRREAIFRGGTSGTVYLPGSPELTNADIRISYLDVNQIAVNPMPADPADNVSACSDALRTTSCIRYVRAEICDASACGGVPYQPLIGFLLAVGGINFAARIPISPVTMPAESLGFVGV